MGSFGKSETTTRWNKTPIASLDWFDLKMEMAQPQTPVSTSGPKRRRCCLITCGVVGVSVGLILLVGLIYWKFFFTPPPPAYYPPPPLPPGYGPPLPQEPPSSC